jgi:hypothetical protein
VLEFSAVLTEVASRSDERSSSRVPLPLDLFELPRGNYARHTDVREAYAAAPATSGVSSDNRPAPDLADFERALKIAKSDAQRLRALRRRIAWALHPDRNTTRELAAALADFNARLDAALATRENR